MTTQPRPIAIDTDPGVDDALALMLALRSPELCVELITTVAGNVPVDIGTANAQRLLALIDPPAWPTLARGAARPLRRPLYTATDFHGQDGLGGLTTLRRSDGTLAYPLPAHHNVRQRAVQRLLDLVRHYGPDLTIIALGPLTNIARAVQQAPDTMQQLGRLIIMGGAISVPGNISPVAEFNMYVDPHAAAIVFQAGVPITLVPLDVTQQVRLTDTLLDQKAPGDDTPLTQMTRHIVQQAHKRSPLGMAMHDPLAVAVAIDATVVQCLTLPVSVETRGQQTLGMTVADRREAAPWSVAMPSIEVALEVDAPRVLELFAGRVCP